MTINKLKAYMLLKYSKGKFFRVDYIKKDGTHRRLVGRSGVKHCLSGTGLRFNPDKKLLFPAWDSIKGLYRMINLDTMQALKIGGMEYIVK